MKDYEIYCSSTMMRTKDGKFVDFPEIKIKATHTPNTDDWSVVATVYLDGGHVVYFHKGDKDTFLSILMADYILNNRTKIKDRVIYPNVETEVYEDDVPTQRIKVEGPIV